MKKKYILPLILLLGMTPLVHAQSKKELKQIIKSQQEQLEKQDQRIDSLINAQQGLNEQFNDLKEQQKITLQQNQELNQQIADLQSEIAKEQAVKLEKQRKQEETKKQKEKQEEKHKEALVAYRKTFKDSKAKLKGLLSKEDEDWEGVPSFAEVENNIVATYNNNCNMGTVDSVDFIKWWKNKDIPQTSQVRTEGPYWVKWGTHANGKPYGRDVTDTITIERKRIKISIECPDKKIYEAYLSPVFLSRFEEVKSKIYNRETNSSTTTRSTRRR